MGEGLYDEDDNDNRMLAGVLYCKQVPLITRNEIKFQ